MNSFHRGIITLSKRIQSINRALATWTPLHAATPQPMKSFASTLEPDSISLSMGATRRPGRPSSTPISSWSGGTEPGSGASGPSRTPSSRACPGRSWTRAHGRFLRQINRDYHNRVSLRPYLRDTKDQGPQVARHDVGDGHLLLVELKSGDVKYLTAPGEDCRDPNCSWSSVISHRDVQRQELTQLGHGGHLDRLQVQIGEIYTKMERDEREFSEQQNNATFIKMVEYMSSPQLFLMSSEIACTRA